MLYTTMVLEVFDEQPIWDIICIYAINALFIGGESAKRCIQVCDTTEQFSTLFEYLKWSLFTANHNGL